MMKVFRAALTPMLFASATVHGTEAVGLLNDTGQFQCYAPNFSMVPCEEGSAGDGSPLPRQDARHGRDAAAAAGVLVKVGGGEHGFDFTRICMNGKAEGTGGCPLAPPLPADLEHPAPNEWACVRDNVSGLTWTLGNPVPVVWAQASSTTEGSYIHTANTSTRCGLDSGWRNPARREGYSLMHMGKSFPPVDASYFPILANPPADGWPSSYWSADTDAARPSLNHVILYGEIGGLASGQCRETVPCDLLCGVQIGAGWFSRVLLVNGEWTPMPWPTEKRGERWEIHESGLVVTDLATGLMWDRCTWGQSGAGCDGDGVIILAWQDAMGVARIANQQRYKGAYDWRVPNVRELESIIKIDATNPAIDISVFPNTAPNYYWTASSSWISQPTAGNRAWAVRFLNGMTSNSRKVPSATSPTPDIARIRLVRGGQPLAAFDGVNEALFFADFEGAPATVH